MNTAHNMVICHAKVPSKIGDILEVQKAEKRVTP